MNLRDYQNFTPQTAIYPKEHAVGYLVAGLCSEAGEVAGKYKKKLRDNVPDEVFKEQMVAELGDVCWYISQICNELGLDFSEVITMNQRKLKSRLSRDMLGGEGDHR